MLGSIFSYTKNFAKSLYSLVVPEKSLIKNIFWLDQKVDNEFNQRCLDIIKYEFSDLVLSIKEMKEEKELFNIIKEIKFEIFIVIVSGLKFPQYIDKLKQTNLTSIPLTIIFTSNKEELKKKIDENYKIYLEDKFYNPLGIVDQFDDLKNKLKSVFNELKDKLNDIKLGNLEGIKDYQNCFTFEYIDNENKLIFPYLYNRIMSKIKITNDEIKNTNIFILNNYGEIEDIKNLILPLLLIDNIPIDILAKFWSRIYTKDCAFYRNLNNNLMKLNNKNYNSYIQILYSGLNEYMYKDNKILYRGTNISEREMNDIIKKYNEKKDELSYLVYSRAYLSFSLDKSLIVQFLKDIKGTKKVLFKLENNKNNKILSNAQLKDISFFRDENEILFFPFSSFIIKNIYLDNDIYCIDLLYLGVYEEKIKEKIEKINPKEIKEIMKESSFSKDVMKAQVMLNNEKKIENKNNNKIEQKQQNIINEILSLNINFINEEKNKENNNYDNEEKNENKNYLNDELKDDNNNNKNDGYSKKDGEENEKDKEDYKKYYEENKKDKKVDKKKEEEDNNNNKDQLSKKDEENKKEEDEIKKEEEGKNDEDNKKLENNIKDSSESQVSIKNKSNNKNEKTNDKFLEDDNKSSIKNYELDDIKFLKENKINTGSLEIFINDEKIRIFSWFYNTDKSGNKNYILAIPINSTIYKNNNQNIDNEKIIKYNDKLYLIINDKINKIKSKYKECLELIPNLNLEELRTLDLSIKDLSAKATPLLDLLKIEKYKKLEKISFAYNGFKFYHQNIKIKLEKLEKLNMSGRFTRNKIDTNKFGALLETFNLNGLKDLNLSGYGYGLSDISFLKNVNLEKLEKLNLSGNIITNIDVLESVNFKELKELNLSSVNLFDVNCLQKIKFEKLEKLIFAKNKLSNLNILENIVFKFI